MEVKVIGQMDNSVDHTFESANRIYDTNGLAPTLPTGCGGGHLPKIITRKKHSYDSCICIEIPTLVKKRKYQIDILSLQNLLRVQKKRLKIATKDIAEQLNISITQAEHYFRTDKYFAIPDEDVWDDLANILEIKDKDLGMKIKTFVYQKGVFEKNERNYSVYGLCPTIMAFDDIRIIEK